MKYFAKRIEISRAPSATGDIVRAEMFLCTKDIKVGDRWYLHDSIDDVIGSNIRKEKDDWGSIMQKNAYKRIGVISPDATWVEDGEEIKEEDIRWAIHKPYEEVDWDSYKNWLESPWHKDVQIKGSCGHFH